MKSTLRNAIYSLCLLIALGPSLAVAQSAPATLPDHTVYGRIGTTGSSGPGQAIPFATLKSQLASATAPISITDAPYNAKCDGVTNDTAAIASAIFAAPSLGTVVGPSRLCLVSGVGSTIFTYAKPIWIVGLNLLVSASVPTTTDIFYINPTTPIVGGGFMRLHTVAAGTPGQHVIHVDTTANTSASYSNFTVENSSMGQTGGGYSLYLQGRSDGVGTFFSKFTGSQFNGGVRVLYGGDTINFTNNFLGGINTGILSSQASGAGNLVISQNNIAVTGFEAIIIDSGVKPIIVENVIEHAFNGALTGSGVINIRGTTATVLNPTIDDNQIQVVNSGLGNPNPIYIGAASDTQISLNRVNAWSGVAHVVNSASAVRTNIGGNNVWANQNTVGSLTITDSGSATIYGPLSKGTAFSVIGVSGSAVAPPKDIIAGSSDQLLRVQSDGGALGFGAINLAGTAAVGSSILAGTNGGTGVNNGSKTITLGGNLTTSGAFNSTFTMTGTTGVTFPTSGTLATTTNANVASVSNGDGTLTISPTTGSVVASINLAHANTWTGVQTLASPTVTGLLSILGTAALNSAAGGNIFSMNGTANTNYMQISSNATNKDSAYFVTDGTNAAYMGFLGFSGCGAGTWVVYNGGCALTVNSSMQVKAVATTASTSSTTGALISAGGIGAAGAVWGGTYVATTPTTVSVSGTTCAIKGARWFVTDNNTALSFGAVITSGGSIQTPIYCDGTVWRQGANDNMPAQTIRKFAAATIYQDGLYEAA